MEKHVVLLAGLALVGCAAKPSTIPETLKVPDTQRLLLETRAVGVQVYQCRTSEDDPAVYVWTLKEPMAELFDAAGNRIGRHYGGPTWESDVDGSKVVGDLKARANPSHPDAVQWLLLDAKANWGVGVFGRTTAIQRVYTSGGQAPPEGCVRATAGVEARIPFKATYYFYGSRS
ncbi:MAG TPA: DUF3455 domain-containing protein [Burkholderiales bacterium]|nr:DUF3455 domain-containing protein [Burkholderiales bacterium]